MLHPDYQYDPKLITAMVDPLVKGVFEDASSINFRKSVVYGFGIVSGTFVYLLNRAGLLKSRILQPKKNSV